MHTLIRFSILALVLICSLSATTQAVAITSSRLTDVIKSTGQGTIDLSKDITLGVGSTLLETFRQEGGGALLFGVDINEAASGTEKASAQGIAIKSVTLTVTVGGVTKSYHDFVTKTEAILTENSQALPNLYHTLLGDSGSNRITGGNTIQGEFDSVLTVFVPDPDNLNGATAATLSIELLTTKTTLGDPEAFYDFSNGFEDLALLNAPDAAYLESNDFGMAEAPAVILVEPPVDTTFVITSWLHYPAQNDFYFVAYEDLYPSKGDYDFNDLVVAYQVRTGLNDAGMVVALAGDAFLVARGSGYDHNWSLRIPGSGSGVYRFDVSAPSVVPDLTPHAWTGYTGSLDLKLFASTKTLLARTGSDFVNTETGQATYIQGPKASFYVELNVPLNTAALAPPFDPYLEVLAGSFPKIQLKSFGAAYADASGFPFAMVVPRNLKHPFETVDFGLAYPRFADFVLSSGKQQKDWYTSPASGKVYPLPLNGWSWPAPEAP